MGFIDTMRSAGQAVESVCRVLPEQGCQVVFHTGPYRTIADVEYATAGWVDWYNNRRVHGSLGMLPPTEYEQAHYAALNPEPQPA